MNSQFREQVERLDSLWVTLKNMSPIVASQLPADTPHGGVYLFSEGGKNLYAGRTKRRISDRIKYHFSTANDCPFAWLLARDVTGKKATYKVAGSRKALLADAAFRAEYERAKARIKMMDVKYVHEADPLSQALLEIYVAIAADARYNDFDTH